MGIKYLWDTNTVIYYLQKHFTESQEKLIDSVINEFQPAISVITEIELLCWKTATDSDLAILQSFITDCVVFDLEQDIKVKTVGIRKQSRLKLPDAIIAATASVKGLTLISRNTSDFKKVISLKLLDPFNEG
jgi:predicted nucleic acid-binding protein